MIYANIFGLIKDALLYAWYLYLFTKNTTKVCIGYLIPDKSITLVLSSFDLYYKAIK